MQAPIRTGRSDTVSLADIRAQILARIDSSSVVNLPPDELAGRIDRMISQLANERGLPINKPEQARMTLAMVDDIMGLGPLEPLVRDKGINDILVNGPDQIYVEREGKLELTNVTFRDEDHTIFVAQRIAATIGRRIDESSPMLDARLSDGSRVNIIFPPLAVRGPYISIRKFSKDVADFKVLIHNDSLTPAMAATLAIASRCRLNIVISGGTGAGKTTLLNAMSQNISAGERVVTIEDVVELQLRQPHVLPMETRPPNIEGKGEVVARDLVRNALRMRPDRIIVGEVRGTEAFDMMQAMNTGHNGSMTTIHANTPTDAVRRIENMVQMGETNLPVDAIRAQIFSAVDMIVQVERMRDGIRRVTSIDQLTSFEDGEIKLTPLWQFRYVGEDDHGQIIANFEANSITPAFYDRLEYFNLGKAFMQSLAGEVPELP